MFCRANPESLSHRQPPAGFSITLPLMPMATSWQPFRPPTQATTAWRALVAVTTLRDSSVAWAAQFELTRQWYQPHLEQRYDDAAACHASKGAVRIFSKVAAIQYAPDKMCTTDGSLVSNTIRAICWCHIRQS
jgi:hypothetical protein